MPLPIAATVVTILEIHLGLGVAFALVIAVAGPQHLDPRAAHGTWGFRLLILPGTALLWPVLLRSWLRRRRAARAVPTAAYPTHSPSP